MKLDQISEAYVNMLESFTVTALKTPVKDSAEEIKGRIVKAGGKVIHHEVEKTGTHRIYSNEGGAKMIHIVSPVREDEYHSKFRKVDAKSTYQSKKAGKMDIPRSVLDNPNHGEL